MTFNGCWSKGRQLALLEFHEESGWLGDHHDSKVGVAGIIRGMPPPAPANALHLGSEIRSDRKLSRLVLMTLTASFQAGRIFPLDWSQNPVARTEGESSLLTSLGVLFWILKLRFRSNVFRYTFGRQTHRFQSPPCALIYWFGRMNGWRSSLSLSCAVPLAPPLFTRHKERFAGERVGNNSGRGGKCWI